MKSKIQLIFCCLIAIILALGFYYYQGFHRAEDVNFGITFSSRQAAYLGFNPKWVFLDIITDLKPKKMRLIAYWEDIEPKPGKFEFISMDEMLIEAGKRNVDIVLVLGRKQPRWPQCHQPDWYNNLDSKGQNDAVVNMISIAVDHFKQFGAIKAWQVENEPYLGFGASCPQVPADLLSREIQAVKIADSRPVLVTDRGQTGNWAHTAKTGDILGITMYRTVYSDLFGYYKYPWPALFYQIKAGVFERKAHKPIVGIELQAEPWFTKQVFDTELDTQKALMNTKIFNDNIEYARRVGFADNYLWGAEWWYWMARTQNDWGMWTAAKNLLNNQ